MDTKLFETVSVPLDMTVGTGGQGGGGQLPPQYFANQKNEEFKNSEI